MDLDNYTICNSKGQKINQDQEIMISDKV